MNYDELQQHIKDNNISIEVNDELLDFNTIDIDNVDAQSSKEVKKISDWEVLTPTGWSNFSSVKKIVKPYCYHIKFSNGNLLKCSPYHKFLMKNGEFKYTYLLKKNDEVITGDRVISKRKKVGEVELFDLLDVEKNSIYYTSEVVSSNCAAISWMEDIWAAAGLTLTRSQGKCIVISTPKGSQGWYFEQYTNAEENNWNIINAHWTEHPIYNLGQYRWIEDKAKSEGGYIEFMKGDTWPDMNNIKNRRKYKCTCREDYNFIRDGRIRSPWYDAESKVLGAKKTRCELDCSFAGSGGEVLNPEIVRDLEILAKEYKQLNEITSGPWKNYKQWKKYEEGCKYILVSDVATGDGSDFSTFVVINLNNFEIVATYKDQFETAKFAEIINTVAREYGNALVIVEHQFGLSVLISLRDTYKYTNLFYSTLKREDPSQKDKKRKIGFWQTEKTRTLGGDKLEEMLNTKKLIIPCPMIINELYTWIWSKRGRRDHAEGKHDDLIMSLTIAMFYIFHIERRQADFRDGMKTIIERNIVNLGDGLTEDDIFDLYLQ